MPLSFAVLALVGAMEVTKTDAPTKPWEASVGLSHHMKAVVDADPVNEQSMAGFVSGCYRVWSTLCLGARVGFQQFFVAHENESGFFLGDTEVSASYRAKLPRIPMGSLTAFTSLGLRAPTSRRSLNNSMQLHIRQSGGVAWRIGHGLTWTVHESWNQYVHAYAEQAGMYGGMNTQAGLGLGTRVSYEPPLPWNLPVRVTGGVHGSWIRKYDSRDTHDAASSDAAFWSPSWGWSFSASVSPVPWMSGMVTVQHAQPLWDGGVLSSHFAHRDVTELVFGVTGRL